MKTTRNIQEGLPFTIEDVKRQTEDRKLLEAVRKTESLAAAYNKFLTCNLF